MSVRAFLGKLGKAMVKKGGDLLQPLAVFDPTGTSAAGKALLEVAADVLEQYQQENQLRDLRMQMEQLLVAGQEQLRLEVRAVVEEISVSIGQEMREQLAGYLGIVQASARQAARIRGDSSGTTVPMTVNVDQPQELAAFLPQRPPRFHIGACVPGRPEWLLVELLGAGGFGEVWKAHNEHVGDAAFKFFLDPQARQRFAAREAGVIRQVRMHGHREGVVPLLDASLAADPPWLAFEYIDGGDLSALAASWQTLPTDERISHIHQAVERLARVVGYFHRLDPPVVHRDLKPSNILVRKRGTTNPELLVADFGIGQVLPANLAPVLSSAVVATVRAYTSLYASPQHKKFHKADTRDDVYALGVIWYQLLRGDLTLERPSGEGWKRVLLRLGLEEACVALLNRCWDDEPDERPADGLELAEQLAALRQPARSGNAIRQIEAQNVERWEASGAPQRWVASKRGQWDHAAWEGLLAALRTSTFWPMDSAAVGVVLERERTRWIAEEQRAESVRHAEAERLRAEQERQRLAEAERQRRDAEERRLAEEAQRQKEEARRRAEAERRLRETQSPVRQQVAPQDTPATTPVKAGGPEEVCVFGHSLMFYWWPLWAVGFILGIWAVLNSTPAMIVPGALTPLEKARVLEEIDSHAELPDFFQSQDVILLRDKREFGGSSQNRVRRVRTPANTNLGLIFLVTLLVLTVVNNVPLRGLSSILVVLGILLAGVTVAVTGWWTTMFSKFGLAEVSISAGGYFVLSGVLFVVWLATVLIFDRQTYMVFVPGQFKVCTGNGEGEKVFDATGISVQRESSNIFRHGFLGFGSGDLVVRAFGNMSHNFTLPNVLFIGRKLRLIEELRRRRSQRA